MSSRLVYAPSGRPLYVEITSPAPELEHGLRVRGARHRVLDDERAGAVEGEPTRPPPTLEDAATALVRTGSHALEHRAWTDSDRAEARRLQAEGLSWAQIAERVCGDKRYKPTVAMWLKKPVAGSGDRPVVH